MPLVVGLGVFFVGFGFLVGFFLPPGIRIAVYRHYSLVNARSSPGFDLTQDVNSGDV